MEGTGGTKKKRGEDSFEYSRPKDEEKSERRGKGGWPISTSPGKQVHKGRKKEGGGGGGGKTHWSFVGGDEGGGEKTKQQYLYLASEFEADKGEDRGGKGREEREGGRVFPRMKPRSIQWRTKNMKGRRGKKEGDTACACRVIRGERKAQFSLIIAFAVMRQKDRERREKRRGEDLSTTHLIIIKLIYFSLTVRGNLRGRARKWKKNHGCGYPSVACAARSRNKKKSRR